MLIKFLGKICHMQLIGLNFGTRFQRTFVSLYQISIFWGILDNFYFSELISNIRTTMKNNFPFNLIFNKDHKYINAHHQENGFSYGIFFNSLKIQIVGLFFSFKQTLFFRRVLGSAKLCIRCTQVFHIPCSRSPRSGVPNPQVTDQY